MRLGRHAPALLAALLALLPAGGCPAGGKAEGPAAPVPAADVTIEAGRPSFRGRSLPLRGPLPDWIAVLGPGYRVVAGSGVAFYVWDALGLGCSTRGGRGVDHFFVAFRSYDVEGVTLKFWPATMLARPVVADGAVLDRDTPIARFNAGKRGKPFRESYLPSIYTYRVEQPVDRDIQVTLNLNRKREIVELSVSWPYAEDKPPDAATPRTAPTPP